jgi:hypothetical protein
MSAGVTPRRSAKAPPSGAADNFERSDRPARPRPRLAVALALEAVTVGVFAILHLSGVLRVGSGSGPSYGAGVAEGLICLALVGGAWALHRSGAAARGLRAALSAVVFAVFGFLVGLSFTVDGGDAIDLAYHIVMLPVLIGTAAALALSRPEPNR